MRLVLLLLMTTCVTGCVPQFPFYCEDAQASICYLQRRPIFAPRHKPTSAPTPEHRESEPPTDAPQSPSAPGAPSPSAPVSPCEQAITRWVWDLAERPRG
jgi:hypothetical protein